MNILRNALIRNSHSYSDKIAIIFNKTRMTYREVNDRVNIVANGLRELGVRKGMKVSLLFKNQPEFVESFLALQKLGVTIVPLNFRLVGRELSYQINNSESSALIFDFEFAEMIQDMRDKGQTEGVERYIVTGGDDIDMGERIYSYEHFFKAFDPDEPSFVEINEDDIFLLQYTSGTTGLPKGAGYRFYSTHLALMEAILEMGVMDADIILCVAPLFHVAGWGYGLFMGIMQGATIVIRKSFDPKDVVETIEREKITAGFLVPTMATAMLEAGNLEQHDVSSFRKWFSTAEALPEGTKRGLREFFPNARIWENYGSTEAGNVSRLSYRVVDRKRACVGLPVITQQVRVVDDGGKDVKAEEVGEIVVKGPSVIKEYYNNPKETKEAFTENGWFRTGDLGRFDGEGYIYLVGRKKDMIISGGENIYPKEVENVLLEVPGIADAAVIGIPDAKWGESVCAVVVLELGETIGESEIIDFCKENLASYKKPKCVRFAESLPKNPSGKVLKHVLREQYKDGLSP